MSLLRSIRKHTFIIFCFIILLMIFFLFDPGVLIKIFYDHPNYIGKVNGEKILEKNYLDKLSFIQQFRNSKVKYYDLNNEIWNILLQEKILNQEAKKIGISVTDYDFWKSITTDSIYNQIVDFQNREGKLDINKFKLYIKHIENVYDNIYPNLSIEKKIWNYEKNNIKNNIISRKYIEMLINGLNTSKYEIINNIKEKNYYSLVNYVFIPYSELIKKYPINISDNFVKEHIRKNQFLYKKQDLRNINCILLYNTPSYYDEKNMFKKIYKLSYSFKKNNINPYKFSINNSDSPVDFNFYFKEQLPNMLQVFINKKHKLYDVFGPIKENNFYLISKLTGIKKLFDSVLISQILISHKNALKSSNSRTKEKAKDIAYNIFKILKIHPDKFKYFSLYKSDSPYKNNNLGWIKYTGNSKLKQLNIFSAYNKKGTIKIIETELGYHILRIDNVKNPKIGYQFSTIIKFLKPSNKTIIMNKKKINNFLISNRNNNINKIIYNSIKDGYESLFLETITRNQYKINGLNTHLGSEIIKWSFDKNRKIADKKIFSDKYNNYILVYLVDLKDQCFSIREIKNRLLYDLQKRNIYKILYNKFKKKNLYDISLFFNKKITKSKVNFYSNYIDNYKEPKIIGNIFSLKQNMFPKLILGNKGVFFINGSTPYFVKINYKSIIKYEEIEKINNIIRKDFVNKLENTLINKSKIIDYRKQY